MRLARRRFLATSTAFASITIAARASAATGIADRFVPVSARDAAAPPLALSDLQGKPHDLRSYRGRVVLINFWATWCAPCLEELPSLQLLQARLEHDPFTLLLVNYGESIERVTPFAEAMALDPPVLLDAFHRVRHDWKVRALPTSFLIDPRRRRRYVVRGELDWANDDAVARIRSLIR